MNKHTTPEQSTILRNKLGQLVTRLQSNALPSGANPSFATQEEVVIEATKILSNFYKDLSEPAFKPTNVIVDTSPDPTVYNDNFLAISDDLTVVFDEFENLEGVVLGNFNYLTTRLNLLNKKLKSVSSKLGDYILFSDLPTKDAIFFGDSFSNVERVEVNSPLLNNEQAEVNQAEGIVTLPIDRGSQVAIQLKELPVVNANSNGVFGNNHITDAPFNGDLSVILDNNPDTWFEYERVVAADDGIALVLDFTLNIGEEKVINSVRINPNNFGTRTQVEILEIETSTDGDAFVSIKDEIPISGYTAEDEQNVFALASSTSKFAGQGLYTFTPRKAKYVHLILRQSTAYVINNTQFRYAIGIRDVEIMALPYKKKGEVISTNYSIGDEVSKVALISSQNPDSSTVSQLAAITHFVSPDNGVTWYQLRPKASSGVSNLTQAVPEILEFNGASENTVNTANPVNTLRYKALLERNSDGFNSNSSELAQIISDVTELHSPPTTTPFEIKLQNTPIDNTMKLIDPLFGSRGFRDIRYQIAVGTGGKKIIDLPFRIKRDYEKVFGFYPSLSIIDPQTVYVDGVEWTRELSSSSTSSGLHYSLNFESGLLEFGNGTVGKAVPAGSVISMNLSEEKLFPSRGTPHVAKLAYPTSIDKTQVEITAVRPVQVKTVVLKKGIKVHELGEIIEQNVLLPVTISDTTIFANNIAFIDGSSEFSGAPSNQYSIDYEHGILYSEVNSDTTKDTTVTFFYRPRKKLSDSEWVFTDGSGVADSIEIKDVAFETYDSAISAVLPTGGKYFNLADLAVVKGTVVFSPASGVFAKEVDFADGRSELLGAIKVREEIAPITGVVTPAAESFQLNLPIMAATDYSIAFSNTDVFATLVGSAGAVNSTGEYFVERSTRTVTVWADADIDDPGDVDYYYVDPSVDLTGRYSINYQTGEVYTYSTITAGYTVQYEYTDYRVKYNIAREVPTADWTFDKKTNKISIKDREILKNMRTPQTVEGVILANKYYQVSYKYAKTSRPDIQDLEPFFSPILKDYALKVITKSRLV